MGIGDILRERWRKEYPNAEILFEIYWPNLSFESQVQINLDLKGRIASEPIIGDTRYPILVENEISKKLFVTSNLETRVERAFVNPNNKKSKDDIKEILQQREQNELKLGKQLTQNEDYDYRNPQHYHVRLDTTDKTVDQEVEFVLDTIGLIF